MAAPPEVTTLNLSGTFSMNKELGDDPDEILRLQGISWFKRKIIGSITIMLYIKHYKGEGVEHIDIHSIGTGGFKGNFEQRILNWISREVDDPLFGPVVGKSRRINIDDIEYEWHKEAWSEDTREHGNIESYVESDTAKSGKTWVADQGFGEFQKYVAKDVMCVGSTSRVPVVRTSTVCWFMITTAPRLNLEARHYSDLPPID